MKRSITPLVTHPESGVVLLELALGKDGPTLTLRDCEGKPCIRLTASSAEGAAVEVLGQDGQQVAALYDGGQADGGTLALNQPNPADSETPLAQRFIGASDQP